MPAVVRGQTDSSVTVLPFLLGVPDTNLSPVGHQSSAQHSSLFNAPFIIFFHFIKADSIETQLNSRSSPKYFPKAGLFRERLG